MIDVAAAAARIAPFVHRTPVLRSPALDEWAGAELFVKAEQRQHTGAFKYRGATNAVQSLSPQDALRGVAAHSSGNHAAALALAARMRDIPAFVVMPKATSSFKAAAVEQYGARISWCDNTLAARHEILAEVLTATGAVEVHPFNDERVIAGAGTAAMELVEEIPGLDIIVTPVGGGGLCSGTCCGAPGVRVLGGEPADRSATIADGLRTGTSTRTNAILREHFVERIAVGEDDIVDAMAAVHRTLGEVIEPSAAVAFAAARRAGLRGLRAGIICSGGNVDPDALPS